MVTELIYAANTAKRSQVAGFNFNR